MKLATAVAAGLVLASPAQADDFPKECSASLTALTISGVEAFCKDLRVTNEGGCLLRNAYRGVTVRRSRTISFNST